jgi:hypothetical protein
MPVLKRRHRTVTFRVSSEEYEALERACITLGSRSISDFARSAVMYRSAMLSLPRGLLSEDLATLSKQLTDLDVTLRGLRQQIRRVLGSVQPEDADADDHTDGMGGSQ